MLNNKKKTGILRDVDDYKIDDIISLKFDDNIKIFHRRHKKIYYRIMSDCNTDIVSDTGARVTYSCRNCIPINVWQGRKKLINSISKLARLLQVDIELECAAKFWGYSDEVHQIIANDFFRIQMPKGAWETHLFQQNVACAFSPRRRIVLKNIMLCYSMHAVYFS